MVISRYSLWCILAFFVLASPFTSNVSAASPDVTRGQQLFQTCVRCHTISKDGEHRFGPNLHGLMDRGIAGAPDFQYSPALLAEGGAWTRKSLNAFIAKPHLAVPDNDMPYSGLMSPHERADLLDWLIDASANANLSADVDRPLTGADSGNATIGKRLFRTCKACHSHEADAPHEIGPNLFGVMGRPIASADGFDYAGNLVKVEGAWTPERLDRFLLAKKEFKQGTHRAFKTLRGPIDRADLIAYLATLRDGDQ
ncbi:c-type cytochrome [Kordiimonas lacus]|uniref:Cytochrome c2 n=1 Tax=Kordiimonas lacus TaxID=637679 RepID=A0A1G6VLP1_9PROT|nr:c-type cytochrome [Kordiimonas lacus]SDD54323.1 Cytochrome c2 [Kordiimonas lacus]